MNNKQMLISFCNSVKNNANERKVELRCVGKTLLIKRIKRVHHNASCVSLNVKQSSVGF